MRSIFLYNSELWTQTKQHTHDVDVIQRTLLRRIVNIRWPKKISNKDFYEKTSTKAWSIGVKRRRFNYNWTSVLCLPKDSQVKQALRESQRLVKRPKGKPKLTWFKLITTELPEVYIHPLGRHKTTLLEKPWLDAQCHMIESITAEDWWW